MDIKELELVGEFVRSFEIVFDCDWSHTEITIGNWFTSSSFIQKVEDLNDNWSNHENLIIAYWQLVKVLDKYNIAHSAEDIFNVQPTEIEKLQAESENLRSQLAEAQGENNFQECRWNLAQRMLDEGSELRQELEKTNQQLQAELENLRSYIKFLPKTGTD